jgi:hypothetical protein
VQAEAEAHIASQVDAAALAALQARAAEANAILAEVNAGIEALALTITIPSPPELPEADNKTGINKSTRACC